MMKRLLRLLLSRMLLVQITLQQTGQFLVRDRRRHRPSQRRLRVSVDGAVVAVLVVVVVEVPEALPQRTEAADGRQGGSSRRWRRQPGDGHGRRPVLGGGGELIARDSRGRGGRQGLVDVEGPEKGREESDSIEGPPTS